MAIRKEDEVYFSWKSHVLLMAPKILQELYFMDDQILFFVLQASHSLALGAVLAQGEKHVVI